MQYSAAPVDQNLEMAMMEDGGARYAGKEYVVEASPIG